MTNCPADNTEQIEQDDFFSLSHFDPHKIGWLICGCAAGMTCLISIVTILGHAKNYNRPLEQRQIIRVLLFPPVYAIVSFFSYRFFRYYEYWDLGEAAYEAFAIAAFLMLMLQYVGSSVRDQNLFFANKDKKPLPLPFCCWRYRPSKAYFLILLKWSVVQYCIVRPAISIAGIVTEYYEVYCPSSWSYRYANVYLASIDFIAISIALYGLIVLYILVKDDLKGKKPLAKFATIKLGIFLIFYQGFIFSALATNGVLRATQYWTTTNIADGLNALCTTIEMVLIAAMQMWAFFWGEYYSERLFKPTGKANEKGKTSIFPSLLHAFNFSDIFLELWGEITFAVDRMRGKEYTKKDTRFDFVQIFGARENHGDKSGILAMSDNLKDHNRRQLSSSGDATSPGRHVAPCSEEVNYQGSNKSGTKFVYNEIIGKSSVTSRYIIPNQSTSKSEDYQISDTRENNGSTDQYHHRLTNFHQASQAVNCESSTYAELVINRNADGHTVEDLTDSRAGTWEPQAL